MLTIRCVHIMVCFVTYLFLLFMGQTYNSNEKILRAKTLNWPIEMEIVK